MRATNKTTKDTLDRLFALLGEPGSSKRFGEYGERIMPVLLTRLSENIYSVARVFEQNFDICFDLEVTMVRGGDGRWYPYGYRQDTLGLNVEWATNVKDDGSFDAVNVRMQRDLADSTNDFVAEMLAHFPELRTVRAEAPAATA